MVKSYQAPPPIPVKAPSTTWLDQIAAIFGGGPKRYHAAPGQLKASRDREEQFRRYGAAERKRQRRQQRNLRNVHRQQLGQ